MTQQEEDSDSEKARKEWVSQLALFSSLSAEVAAYTLSGVGLGYLAYDRFDAPGWIMALLGFAGLCLALLQFMKRVKK